MMSRGMETRALRYETSSLYYHGVIGTGGIGSGQCFLVNGNHTLGREESRSGQLLDARDYCKQHIILHYVKILLGQDFPVMPIGKLGDDERGRALYGEMEETGFLMNMVHQVPRLSTLYSFCFLYPDGSGGNLTTENSASAQVDSAFIHSAIHEIAKIGKRAMIVAVPEVPLSARKTLLDIGSQQGLFRAASFTSGEVREAMDAGMLAGVDLIALNIDEASAVSGSSPPGAGAAFVVNSAIKVLRSHHRHIMVSVTAGDRGSWCWDGHHIHRFPAIKTDAISTAGAGDAFFSGLLCGLAVGLTLFEAQQLATILAGLSVTSPHTIHHGIERKTLLQFMQASGLTFSDAIIELLVD